MNFKIVTTFKDEVRKVPKDVSNLYPKARRHWEKNGNETICFGLRLAEQAEKFLPSNASLVVYYEGDNLPASTSKVEFRPHVYDRVKQFQSLSKNKYCHKKQVYYSYNHKENKNVNRLGYDYEFDAVRFCHPPLALIDCYNSFDERYLISMDADVQIIEQIPEDFFPSLVKNDAYTFYLSRAPHKHMESGFIIWDTEHEMHETWWSKYKRLYEQGEIYNIFEGWTDCHAFDYVNEQLKGQIKTNHIAQVQTHAVWEHSPLQQYMRHYKGIAI